MGGSRPGSRGQLAAASFGAVRLVNRLFIMSVVLQSPAPFQVHVSPVVVEELRRIIEDSEV